MLLKLEEGQIAAALQQVVQNLGSGEIVLDFTAVQRMDSDEMRTLEELAKAATEKRIGVVLRRLDVDLYKSIKLMKPGARFSFDTAECA
ncbi:MAG TPA: STAS domain-containing protein [Terriglobales bacterium]|nr:STAS domain-containing protein [Terriglobales bacterium]